MNFELLTRFATKIRNAPEGLSDQLAQDLTIMESRPLSAIYAPFDYAPTGARIAIVGITPGRVQADNALRAASRAFRAGKSIEQAAAIAKLEASFSGTQTRNNLVAMLDEVGLASKFGLNTCAGLFAPGSEQVHFTSALRYPVFLAGDNYRGNPSMTRTPALRQMVETYLAEEVRALSGTLWLPLGPKPAEALAYLVRAGVLKKELVLDGMPHPSGLNGERVSAFLGKIDRASIKTDIAKLVAARARLTNQIATL